MPARRSALFAYAALALIVFLFATNLYRAATQSITSDEAHMFQLYVDPPLESMFRGYDAANHVLYTLLARWSVRWFGLSELTLRLPSLLGGLIYLAGVFQASRYAFGRGWLFLLSTALLSLNPFVLDYLSAARGYGLALALFVWGFYLLLRYLNEDYDRPVWLLPWAGLLFGLSVAANLVFLFPVLACGAVVTVAAGRGALDRFWGPGIVPAFVLLVLPLTNAQRGSFYYGATSLVAWSESLAAASLFHATDPAAPPTPAEHGWRMLVATKLVPLLLAAIFAAAVWAAVKRRHCVLVLAAGGLAGSLAMAVAARFVAGVPYPLGRTGIYLAFLFPLACVALLPPLARFRPAQVALAALLVAALWRFAAGYTVRYYSEWRYDSATKRIAAALAPRGPRRVAASPMVAVSIRYYVRAWRLRWQVVDPAQPADAYILLERDRELIPRRGLRPLLQDPVANVALAVPAQ